MSDELDDLLSQPLRAVADNGFTARTIQNIDQWELRHRLFDLAALAVCAAIGFLLVPLPALGDLLARMTPNWYQPLDPKSNQVIDEGDTEEILSTLYNKWEAIPLGDQTWSITQYKVDAALATVEQEIRQRDEKDAERSAAPLRSAHDAYVLDTTTMDADAAFAAALVIVRDRL